MPDPVGVLPRDGDRVAAADEEVPGVEAEEDARAGEDPVGLGPRLDHRPDVGVEGRDEPVRGGRVADPVEVGEQRVPLLVIEDGTAVVALAAVDGGDDEDPRVRREEGVHRGLGLGKRVPVPVVEHERDELADGSQAVARERGRLVLRTVGEEAVGAVLGRDEPERGHLGQDRVGVELAAPARHLAHAPADRRAGEPGHDAAAGRCHRGRPHRHSFVIALDEDSLTKCS